MHGEYVMVQGDGWKVQNSEYELASVLQNKLHNIISMRRCTRQQQQQQQRVADLLNSLKDD